MTEKPSRTEAEFFVRKEADLLKARRAQAEREREEAERKTHFMKCPKCGHDLKVEEYHGLEVDRCAECDGVWFDAGEAEQLLDGEDDSMFHSLFGAVLRGVQGKKAPAAE
jgi:hypothetical protein